MTVGIDAFNLLNVVNHVRYVGVGTITSPVFMRPVTAQPARQLQFSARLKF